MASYKPPFDPWDVEDSRLAQALTALAQLSAKRSVSSIKVRKNSSL
jgi:hypothetical protein